MEIVQYPNKILTEKCPPYQKAGDDLSIAKYMAETMLERKNCAGLAAPQVGIARRFFVMRDGLSGVRYCFDPVILSHGKDLAVMSEGCMSLGFGDRARGGIFLPVPRWRVIDVQYTDEIGKRITTTLKALEARVFQHECDHLEGLLIIKTERDREIIKNDNV